MKSFCNWLRLTGSNKRLKTLAATFRATCIRNFLSLFAQSRTKKSNASMRTGIYRGGASAYWYGCSTATESKSFTGSLESHRTACPNTLMTFQTSITKTSISGKCWHSNTMSNFTGVWHEITTALTGMSASFGRCTARTEA